MSRDLSLQIISYYITFSSPPAGASIDGQYNIKVPLIV